MEIFKDLETRNMKTDPTQTELVPEVIEKDSDAFQLSYARARSTLDDEIWKRLKNVTVSQALDEWLSGLKPYSRINYQAAFKRLIDFGLVIPEQSLQMFSLINHETVIDEIKLIKTWKEATRQARAAAYISFTGFLQRRTQGLVRKAVASKEGSNKTFYKVREKVKTNALTQTQTRAFLSSLEKINKRDALIAKLALQGGKRKSEVLGLTVDQIDYEASRITYFQTKTRGTIKETIVNYPQHIMEELKEYIGERAGLVFVTRNGNRVAPTQLDRNFEKAGVAAGIDFKITPHVLRVTLVTRLKELKIQDTDIMKITGHASPAQLASYDKSDMGDNASLYHHFV